MEFLAEQVVAKMDSCKMFFGVLLLICTAVFIFTVNPKQKIEKTCLHCGEVRVWEERVRCPECGSRFP